MDESGRGAVAVIEDDDIARTALGRLLEAAGWEHALFESAESFLASQDPGWICLIVDVQLPCMSGTDLQRTLRSNGTATRGRLGGSVAVKLLDVGALSLGSGGRPVRQRFDQRQDGLAVERLP